MPAESMRRCAVLGSPIGHSLSPVIHRAAYRELGLDWQYTAHEVDEAGLAAFVAGLDASWRGLSLTMPLKRVVFDVADEVVEPAGTVGAANTLIRADDGRLSAYNTDVPGLVGALAERAVAAAPQVVCVWGGGATAASVLAALAQLDAGDVHVHARSPERARPAISVGEASGLRVVHASWEVGPECREAALTVNTAPAGALDPLAETLAVGASGRALFDVVYDPWPTVPAAHWTKAGGDVVNGLDLLVHQALGQIELMTGRLVPIAVLRDAAERELAARAAP
ncbi:shikimate dehydrogenase [Phytoactinopolyspora halotolerans]|uniref:Shikimate dehydrogenase n=1 Tax=Phytoactinopolyspora halotolerans TaxID=1981512 RepID=A0A6L9S9G1_9ACTN|nr:shikimate dehydrogenase [Phytoactinopolyspora halotolerans]NEE01341.1 shikimate dehydrogenase [Phytoactinopolyspora halotolerans]